MRVVRDIKQTIYPRVLRFIFLAIISLFFTLGSLLLVLVGFEISLGFIDTSIKEGYSHSFVAGIGILGFVIGGLCSSYYFKRLINWKPSIILNHDGLYDNSTATSAGFLKWDEISDVCIYKQEYKIGSQKILGMKLKYNDEFVQRFKGIRRLIIKMGDYPVNIPQNAINVDIEDLYKSIKENIR